MTFTIRPERSDDVQAVRRVNLEAFGGSDEADIVQRLRDGHHVLVSLVAEAEGRVVGHVLFSRLPVQKESRTLDAVALAPLAVVPVFQRCGIGSALIVDGLDRCRARGERIVIVLGHAAYYPKFGFSSALGARLRAPFSGDAFMALELTTGAIAEFEGGDVQYPAAFGL